MVAISAALSLLPTSAFADYGPSASDVVGVGSDTVQAAGNFVADGDYTGNAGYNTAGNLNKFISIDATADANTRLAYGSNGLGSGATAATNPCTPGTGATQGTGNQNTTHTGDKPCVLNPTVVLRAGLSPVQRPNGSGAGYNLLKADTNASGVGTGLVDFARASSPRGVNALFDSVQIGNDPLGMLTSSTTNATNGLSIAQLKNIYTCTVTNWNQVGSGAGTIVPLMPQIGSGTRSYFESAIGVTDSTLGSCVQNVEENDPEAIDASSSPANAVEPMSQSRLFLFQGKLSNGTASGLSGYFKDPSCVALSAVSGCASNTLNPNVKLWSTGVPAPTDSGALFYPTRPLYIYFRHADINSTTIFQPGGTLNWVRTMLFNPGGATPYWCSAAGKADISASGIIPACTYTAGGP
ncbi:MAG: substrate-binding domain-containing protein [Actinobacteria bacterium]|nr:substrate-binding domain-containing protein [Actinomycetota bacterium]